MKVLFKKDVPDVAKAGQVKDVADGYARNFLIPRGLAVAATKGALKQAEHWAKSQTQREAKERTGAEELKAKLESTPLKLTARAGPDGRLFGSVTANDVAQAAQLAKAQEAGARLEGFMLQITQKAGPDGRLFGSVTNYDIVEGLEKQGHKVERSQIRMPQGALKQVGDYPIQIALHTDVTATIKVSVLGEQ